MIEKEIIDLAQKYFYKNDNQILKNIGDDCSVVEGSLLNQLFTTDTLIEDTHFLFDKIHPYLLGWKSLAVNISDIASMGGIPKFALLSLGINKKINVEWLNHFYNGLSECANKYNVSIIGGDTVNSPNSVMISITLTGSTDKPIYRNNIKNDYLIVSTGNLGLSGAGLWCIKNNINNEFCIEKHYKPTPRVEEGLFLSKNIMDLSMIDSSDGLYKSVETMCNQSNLNLNFGADIFYDNLDFHPSLLEISDISKIKPENFILFGGEDYELIFSLSQSEFDNIKDRYKEKFNHQLNVIGKFNNNKNIYLNKENKNILLTDNSYKHF